MSNIDFQKQVQEVITSDHVISSPLLNGKEIVYQGHRLPSCTQFGGDVGGFIFLSGRMNEIQTEEPSRLEDGEYKLEHGRTLTVVNSLITKIS